MEVKALFKTQPHPIFVKVASVYYDKVSDSWMCTTTGGLNYSADLTLLIGDVFGDGVYRITNITEDSVVALDYNGNLITYSLSDLEWDEERKDYFIKTEDEIDEYTSGYGDAIRDVVDYLNNKNDSVVKKTLTKMNIDYCSLLKLDSEEKIAEFLSKRFKKKPQLTLDELKEIVGYDFDLV